LPLFIADAPRSSACAHAERDSAQRIAAIYAIFHFSPFSAPFSDTAIILIFTIVFAITPYRHFCHAAAAAIYFLLAATTPRYRAMPPLLPPAAFYAASVFAMLFFDMLFR